MDMEHQNAAIPDEEGGVASGDEAAALLSSDGGGQYMTTTSLHSFGEFDGAGNGFTIQIIEAKNMREECGMFMWPCSVVLAEYVWQQRLRFAGISVVEVVFDETKNASTPSTFKPKMGEIKKLGAGTSLPGLVAAKVGANVTLTDDLDRPEVLDNIGRACDLNKLKCEVVGLTWGVWDEHIIGLSPQIILGADVLYDTCAFEDLFSTVAFLLESCPGSVFITTYHNRSGHHLIELLLVKWGLKVVKLVDGFSFLPSYKASGLSGNIQLEEIVLNSHLVMNKKSCPKVMCASTSCEGLESVVRCIASSTKVAKR